MTKLILVSSPILMFPLNPKKVFFKKCFCEESLEFNIFYSTFYWFQNFS